MEPVPGVSNVTPEEEVFKLDLARGTVEREEPQSSSRPRRNVSGPVSLAEHQAGVGGDERGWKLQMESFVKRDLEEGERNSNSVRRKSVDKFYLRQNALVDEFVALDRQQRGERDFVNEREVAELESRRLRGVRIAINGSFVLNCCLFVAKIVAVVLSGSISLIASAVDSGLDLMSGSIIFLTACLMKRKRSVYLYPAGNTRIEPIGVVIFASAMFVATFQIVVEAVQKIIDLAGKPPVVLSNATGNATAAQSGIPAAAQWSGLRLDALTMSIIGATIGIKFVMYIYCAAFRNKSSSVRALATDHISDVVMNLFLLGCYIVAYYAWPYMDPVGGLLISVYLMYNWYQEGSIEVRKLSGQSAPPEFLSKLTFLVWNHSPMIVSVDTVRAFHLANGFLVEVDIVLPYDMLLKDAHDIGESLQHRLEALEDVERAYVHLDFETEHVPGTEHPAQFHDSQRDSAAEEDAPLLEQQFELTAKTL